MTKQSGTPGISLVVNARNEEHNLPGLFASTRDADETVVADMESTDGTVAIAKAHGAVVVPLANAGYCEPGRQAALDAASGDWLLVLDGDERLSPAGIGRLRHRVASAPPDVGGFSLARSVFVGDTRVLGSGWEPRYERHARLFRRGRVHWPARIHAAPEVEGPVLEIPETEVWIDHHNFTDLHQFVDKVNRYSTIESADLLRLGKVPALFDGLSEGMAELRRRYSPTRDGALSFGLSFGILVYRLFVHLKAAEKRGWPQDAVPTSEALERATHLFEEMVRLQPINARPAGLREPSGSPTGEKDGSALPLAATAENPSAPRRAASFPSVKIVPCVGPPAAPEAPGGPTWVRSALARVLIRAADRIVAPERTTLEEPKAWAPQRAPLKLHVGCNETRLDGFVNIDARQTPATDLVHSCSDLSPFGAQQAELVFANAFFEHLRAPARLGFLREACRVLEPGGLLYLTGIPDFEGVAKAYLLRKKGHVSQRFDVDEADRYTHGSPEQAPTWWMEQLHKSLTDADNLVALLAEAGFQRWFVFRYAWGDEPNAVNLGVLARSDGANPLDRDEVSEIITAFLPVTNVNRTTLEVVRTN